MDDVRLTLDPATIQRASLSTQFDFRIAFSNNLAVVVSSSEFLIDYYHQSHVESNARSAHLPASKLLEAIGEISVVSDKNPS